MNEETSYITERWLSVDEIAKHLGIAAITIYRWLEKGTVPAHRVGKLWRFKASEVDHWVAEGGADSASGGRKSYSKNDLHQEK
jgi:excisionase family DNA binding protein